MSEDVQDVGTEATKPDGATDSPQDLFAMLREGELDEPKREVDRQYEEFEESLKPDAEAAKDEKPEEAKLDTSKAAAEAKVSQDKTYKFNGQEYTESQLREQFSDPETLMDLLTAREQYRNLNRKHAETVERFKTIESELDRVRSGVAPPPQQQVDTSADIKKVLERDANSWVERGLIDKETYQAIPEVIHLMAYQQRSFQNFRDQVNQVYESAIAPMIETYGYSLAAGERNAIVTQLENRLDQVAAQGGVYESLQEPETRAKFVSFLGQVNPEIGVLYDDGAVDFLASQFVGFQRNQILSMYEQAAQAGQPQSRPDTRFVSGERTGASSGRRDGQNTDIKAVLFSRG